MTRHAVRRALPLLGLLLAAGLWPVPSASAAQTQTIAFSTTPPSGEDWFYGDIGGPIDVGYVADAAATSGLPVTYTIAPGSAGVCRIAAVFDDHSFFGTGAGIEFLGAGTCTVVADQAGDGGYLPAAPVAQSFVIEKVATSLIRPKAKKGIPGLTPTTFSATLLRPYRVSHGWTSVEGYAGQVVTFALGGTPVCSGTTNADGVATCAAKVRAGQWLPSLRFTATFAGSADYKESSVSGWFVG